MPDLQGMPCKEHYWRSKTGRGRKEKQVNITGKSPQEELVRTGLPESRQGLPTLANAKIAAML